MGYLEDAAALRYNNWGEREPLIATEEESLASRAKRMASYQGMSDAAKSFLETRALTGCQGLEFVAFSNAKLGRSIKLPNEVILYPCFIETVGRQLTEPVVQASFRMHKLGKYIYDGWLPIEPTDDQGNLAARIEDLRESLATFALVSGSSFEWEPKYIVSGHGAQTHCLGEDEIATLEDVAQTLGQISESDKHAILRSVAWIARAKLVLDECSKFLFAVLAVESLSNYIENEAEDESPLRQVAGPQQTRAEKKSERERGIRKTMEKHLEANPTKAVQEAYFTCVVPIKRMLRAHLARVMGAEDEGVVLFFDGNPALYDIRHLIAHGGMSNISESDLLQVSQNVWKIERFAARYVWKVLNTCLGLYSRSSKIKASIGVDLAHFVLGNRGMYQGPVEMALLYSDRI